jgi:hypothetical protein
MDFIQDKTKEKVKAREAPGVECTVAKIDCFNSASGAIRNRELWVGPALFYG